MKESAKLLPPQHDLFVRTVTDSWHSPTSDCTSLRRMDKRVPASCLAPASKFFSGNVEQPKQLNIMTSVTSEQLLETSPSTSARYAELQQRYPRDVAPAHIGCALCFKLVDEADKVPGKCSSQVSKKEGEEKKKKKEKEEEEEEEEKKIIYCNLYGFCLFVPCFGAVLAEPI